MVLFISLYIWGILEDNLQIAKLTRGLLQSSPVCVSSGIKLKLLSSDRVRILHKISQYFAQRESLKVFHPSPENIFNIISIQLL